MRCDCDTVVSVWEGYKQFGIGGSGRGVFAVVQLFRGLRRPAAAAADFSAPTGQIRRMFHLFHLFHLFQLFQKRAPSARNETPSMRNPEPRIWKSPTSAAKSFTFFWFRGKLLGSQSNPDREECHHKPRRFSKFQFRSVSTRPLSRSFYGIKLCRCGPGRRSSSRFR